MSKGALIGRIVALERQRSELILRFTALRAIVCECPRCLQLFGEELKKIKELEKEDGENE